MGNSQATPQRKLKHMLPFLHNYKKLSSSSSPTRPLLIDFEEYDSTLMEPYTAQEFETGDFQKKIGAIEREILNLKSRLSKIEARVVDFASEQSSELKKLKQQKEASMKEMSELRCKVANLEKKLTSYDQRMKNQDKVIEKLDKSNTATRKKTEARVVNFTFEQSSLSKKLNQQEEASKNMSELTRIANLEQELTSYDQRMKNQEWAIEKLDKSHTVMSNKTSETVAAYNIMKNVIEKHEVCNTATRKKVNELAASVNFLHRKRNATFIVDLILVLLNLSFLIIVIINLIRVSNL